jgi:hypothetical protein
MWTVVVVAVADFLPPSAALSTCARSPAGNTIYRCSPRAELKIRSPEDRPPIADMTIESDITRQADESCTDIA